MFGTTHIACKMLIRVIVLDTLELASRTLPMHRRQLCECVCLCVGDLFSLCVRLCA